MPKYFYPEDWATYSPLARDAWHRNMGAFIRRVRFLTAIHALDRRWVGVWWGAGRWHDEPGREER